MDETWDLEMELLCLPATGSSVAQLQRLSSKIASSCTDVPSHVKELGNISPGCHRERDLHRWVRKQPWRQLLPLAYESSLPYRPDQL